ncbi:aminotransferase class I/II-fold pyridoxal phosphate-dependent enzyme [Streptomyces sp. YIM 98790]|uniref:aminotransferase class I/II-fold pyridoxal phosphate-dependent enzyme n=1 Tax=Streptomyces sp. YIM 98790 TaxID=2689077 RepID=UPI001409EEDB|nr:aminotransferase class I/II-fold pyridoxal phosphate-dependent enzyme [Streptomyces sp. YIM 98790]
MTELARRTGAVNLGQGVPDLDSPPALLHEVAEAVLAGHNQYPPAYGVPELRQAVAAHQKRRYGLDYAPDGEVLVTTGATEALAATLLALTGPGDEILTLDPAYDAYPAGARLSGAALVPVPLVTEGDGFALDADALRAAVTPRTRVLLFNSPHNPTGKVFRRDELEILAALCREHDLTAVTDEVYEHLVYDGEDHLPLAALPGMRERTVVISSAGKTFNVTGWKVGWICAPAPLTAAVTSVKQFLTYASGTPYQRALAHMLDAVEPWAEELRTLLRGNRILLADGLAAAGLRPYRAEAGYFLQTDVRPWGYQDGFRFCRELPGLAGVVAIPTSAFREGPDPAPWLVRFSFCRRTDALRRAVTGLAAARPRHR